MQNYVGITRKSEIWSVNVPGSWHPIPSVCSASCLLACWGPRCNQAAGRQLQRSRAAQLLTPLWDCATDHTCGPSWGLHSSNRDNALPLVQVRLMISLGDFHASVYLSSLQWWKWQLPIYYPEGHGWFCSPDAEVWLAAQCRRSWVQLIWAMYLLDCMFKHCIVPGS